MSIRLKVYDNATILAWLAADDGKLFRTAAIFPSPRLQGAADLPAWLLSAFPTPTRSTQESLEIPGPALHVVGLLRPAGDTCSIPSSPWGGPSKDQLRSTPQRQPADACHDHLASWAGSFGASPRLQPRASGPPSGWRASFRRAARRARQRPGLAAGQPVANALSGPLRPAILSLLAEQKDTTAKSTPPCTNSTTRELIPALETFGKDCRPDPRTAPSRATSHRITTRTPRARPTQGESYGDRQNRAAGPFRPQQVRVLLRSRRDPSAS